MMLGKGGGLDLHIKRVHHMAQGTGSMKAEKCGEASVSTGYRVGRVRGGLI